MARKGLARLWDGPTRIVHWALVLLIGFAWWSAKTDHMDWHVWSGEAALGLLVFRLVWGFVGSRSATFASFVKGPRVVLNYARGFSRGAAGELPGHNPLGGWSVVAILVTLAALVGTGLFAVDVDSLDPGPLSGWVDFDTGRRLAHWHQVIFTVLEGLVVLHLLAIAFYLVVRRTDLTGPMITGRRRFDRDPGLSFAPTWRAVVVAMGAAALAWWVAAGLRL